MPTGVPRVLSQLRRDRAAPWSAAKPTAFLGRWYRSKGEAAYASKLELLRLAKQIASWRPAPSFRLVVHGHEVGGYRPDFEVTHLDGRIELVEIKGRESRDLWIRVRLFGALYPERWLTILDGAGHPYLRRRKEKR